MYDEKIGCYYIEYFDPYAKNTVQSRKDYQLGSVMKGCKKTNWCKRIYLECPHCHKRRWVTMANAKREYFKWRGSNFLRPCASCSTPNKPKPIGFERKDKSGYTVIKLSPSSPYFCMVEHSGGWIAKHRLVMAEHLGHPLKSWEIVHHKNSNKQDNKIENLEILERLRHRQLHLLEGRVTYLEKKLQEANISF